MDVALVTCARLPDLDDDNRLLLHALQACGVTAAPVVWSDTTVDWSRYRVSIVRSTWDYETQRDAYVRWAERAAQATRLWNPPDVLRWNTDKRYLLELAAKGVPVVPTMWVEAGGTIPLSYLADIWQCRQVVVKPTISACARNTYVVPVTGPMPDLDARRDMLVQPYLSSVESLGELSVVYLGGDFAYAVRKVPRPGDFRVQEEHGGQYQAVTPGTAELDCAARSLQAIGQPLLYARIDLMYGPEGEPWLSEAEVTEPSLYHHIVPGTAEQLAQRVSVMLSRIPA